MTEAFFKIQLSRLQSQWKTAYGPDRVLRIWERFKSAEDSVFEAMVDKCLDFCRTPPLQDELSKFQSEVEREKNQSRIYQGMGGASFIGQMNRAEEVNRKANPDFVKACMKLIKDKYEGKLNKQQFLEGCTMVEQAAMAMK